MASSTPLHRLYRTKFTLLATISTFVGLGLLFWAHWAEGQPGYAWLTNLPASEIGSGLFFAGLFGVLFRYVGQRDAEELSSQRFRQVLSEEAPAIRDAVIHGFAFEPDKLTNVASPATLDRVVENCLAIRLGDKELATDAYADLREQVIRAKERWYDLHVAVVLAPWNDGPPATKDNMFVATIRYEYRVKPSEPVMRFASVSDLDEYRELLHDPSIAKAWYFEPIAGLDGSSPEVFELVRFEHSGRQLPARRTSRAGIQIYTVNLRNKPTTEDREITLPHIHFPKLLRYDTSASW